MVNGPEGLKLALRQCDTNTKMQKVNLSSDDI